MPAGPFVMGSRKGDKEADDSELGNPKLLRSRMRYYIGRYPVTVAQFEAFVSGGGYLDGSLWTRLGWQWRNGDYDSQVKDDSAA